MPDSLLNTIFFVSLPLIQSVRLGGEWVKTSWNASQPLPTRVFATQNGYAAGKRTFSKRNLLYPDFATLKNSRRYRNEASALGVLYPDDSCEPSMAPSTSIIIREGVG